MSKAKGLVIVLSGPAGSGKDTVLEQFFKKGTGAKTISVTTRAMRPGEVNGVDYYFISKDEFESAITRELLLEYTSYSGNYYGTLKSEISRITESGEDVVLKIEVEGGKNVRKLYPDCILVFLMPPSAQILAKRLCGRGTEDTDTIRRRLHTAANEIASSLDIYDYIIVNDSVTEAAGSLQNIIKAEKLRISRNREFLSEVEKDVKELVL